MSEELKKLNTSDTHKSTNKSTIDPDGRGDKRIDCSRDFRTSCDVTARYRLKCSVGIFTKDYFELDI